jgi:hypothetical protein
MVVRENADSGVRRRKQAFEIYEFSIGRRSCDRGYQTPCMVQIAKSGRLAQGGVNIYCRMQAQAGKVRDSANAGGVGGDHK